jgi:hypothetical protein
MAATRDIVIYDVSSGRFQEICCVKNVFESVSFVHFYRGILVSSYLEKLLLKDFRPITKEEKRLSELLVFLDAKD